MTSAPSGLNALTLEFCNTIFDEKQELVLEIDITYQQWTSYQTLMADSRLMSEGELA